MVQSFRSNNLSSFAAKVATSAAVASISLVLEIGINVASVKITTGLSDQHDNNATVGVARKTLSPA